MKLALCMSALLVTAASLWSAPSSTSPDEQSKPVTLAKDPGANPIGVEPQGGRFSPVIKSGDTSGETDFYAYSPYAKEANAVPPYILAIYATNQSLIPLEKPLARVTLSGLIPKEKVHRIHVKMSLNSDRTLQIFATDSGHKLNVAGLSNAQLRTGEAPAPPPIAAGPVAGLKQYIGVRRAGGIFQPLLKLGDTPGVTGTATFGASMPSQKTVDVRVFAANNDTHYIEQTKPFARYLISGFKENAPAKNTIKLTLKVEPGNGVTATAADTATGTLHVAKYSQAELERLKAAGQLGQGQAAQSAFPSLIPSL